MYMGLSSMLPGYIWLKVEEVGDHDYVFIVGVSEISVTG